MSRPVPNLFPATDPGPLRLALIGEAPGNDEVALGVPFSGKSGWALNGWLASAGISRSQVFLGNVCQCQPGPSLNDFHFLDWNGPRVQAGIEALREDLTRFRPNVVVCLGNAALHLFRHGNAAPPKSAKLGLFQWRSHIGTWRGSLFLAAASFDPIEASNLRSIEGRCPSEGNGAALPSTPFAAIHAASREAASSCLEGPETGGGTPFPDPTASGATLCTTMAGRSDERLGAGIAFAGEDTPGAPAAQRGTAGALPAPLTTKPRGGLVRASTDPLAFDLAGNGVQCPVEGVECSRDRAYIPPPLLPAVIEVTQTFKEADLHNAIHSLGKEHLAKLGWPVEALNVPPPYKCLGTYHPAATFREPSFVFPLVSDLKRAVAEARSAELVLPPRHIEWGLPIEILEQRCYLMRVAKQPVGFDIEGGLGGLQCASFARSPSEAFVIDLMGEQLERPRTLAVIASVLEDPAVPKVLWNAAYERAILHATAGITLRGYEDGMLAWWERFSELPKGLDYVASILTREPYWAEGIGWDKRTGAPKVTGPRFLTYNALDSMVTLEIWQSPLIQAVAESRTPVAFTL